MQMTVICESCGKKTPLPDGAAEGYCANCGAKLESNAVNSAVSGISDVGLKDGIEDSAANRLHTDDANVSPRKKTPVKALIAVFAVVVVAVASFIGFTALGGDSYQKAETNFITSLFKTVPEPADVFKLIFSAEYSPGDFISSNAGIAKTELNGTLTYNSEKALAETMLLSNGVPVSSLAAAFEGSDILLSTPELTKYSLLFRAADIVADNNTADIDRNKMNASMRNIAKAYFTEIKDVTTAVKGTVISRGGVSVKCDEYTIDFTESVAAKIGLVIIDELQNNADLMSFTESYAASMGISESDFQDMIIEAKEELRGITGSARLFRMTVWVAENDVISRKIDNVMGINAEFSYMVLSDANNVHVEAGLNIEDMSLKLDGGFTKSSGEWNGELTASASDGYNVGELLNAKVIFTGISASGEHVLGDISIVGVSGDAMLDFNVGLTKNADRQIIALTGAVSAYGENIDLGEFILSYEQAKVGDFALPPHSEDMIVTSHDYSEENVLRAEIMAEELYERWYSDDYDDNMLVSELIYMFWSYVDDIVFYSDFGYSYDFSDYGYFDEDYDDYYEDYYDEDYEF